MLGVSRTLQGLPNIDYTKFTFRVESVFLVRTQQVLLKINQPELLADGYGSNYQSQNACGNSYHNRND